MARRGEMLKASGMGDEKRHRRRSQGRIAGYRIGEDQSGGNGTILQPVSRPDNADSVKLAWVVGILLAFAVAIVLAIADRGLHTFAEPCCALVVSPAGSACQDLMGRHHEQRQFAFAP
jgi:hypothetical protein